MSDPIPDELIHVTEQNLEVRKMRLAGKSQKEITQHLLEQQAREKASQALSEANPEIAQVLDEQEKQVDRIKGKGS